MAKLTKVTRLEVINHQDGIGREYTKHNCESVEISLQDDGRTLKVFISKKQDLNGRILKTIFRKK